MNDIREETEAAKAAGCIFYHMPWGLEHERPRIDALIWPAIEAINKSGWCYTGESCQGHPDATDCGAWAGNTNPFVRLITRQENEPRMMSALVSAYREARRKTQARPFDGRDHIWEVGFLKVVPSDPRPGWSEILVYIGARNAYQRDQAILVWNEFAKEVCKP